MCERHVQGGEKKEKTRILCEHVRACVCVCVFKINEFYIHPYSPWAKPQISKLFNDFCSHPCMSDENILI